MRKLTIVAGALAALAVSVPCVAQSPILSAKDAARFVKPYYDALMAPTPAAVRSIAESVTAPNWHNCIDETVCETREQAITRWGGLRKLIPDFNIEMREVFVVGNKIIVRGEMTGTPVGHSFFGVDPQGRSYRIMTTDIHEVVGGKIVHSYHLEDWMRGLSQLRGDPQP